MPVSRTLSRARSKGSLLAKLFQRVKAAQKPDQPDCLNALSTVNLIPDSGNCYLNQRLVLCVFCRRRRLCAPGPAVAQGLVLDDVSSIMLIALEAIYQTIQLLLSKPDNMVQCPISPGLRSRYLGWLDMYHDTHHLHSPQGHAREKTTTDVGIAAHDRAHTFALNVSGGMEYINERLNCLLLMRLFHRLFKAVLSIRLDSPSSNLLLTTLGPIELYVSTYDQRWAYAALWRSVRNAGCSTENRVITRRVEIRLRVLQSGGPTIGYGNVPFTTRSVPTLHDMECPALDHSLQLRSLLQQQDAPVRARVVWPGMCGIHWNRELDIHGQSNVMMGNTSLVQNGDEATKQVGDYSDQGQERHQRDSQPRQRSSTWPSVLIQKRRADSEESQDDDKRKRSGPGSSYKRRRLDNEKTLRFACPFFKYNPNRYAEERACCGPGWSTVNRVKEHLYRRHSLPDHQCNRCLSRFKTNEKLREHHRESQPCAIQDEPPALDGLNQETLSRLKMRPKKPSPASSSFSTEEQKWYSMYSIIFPDHTSVPSPYYDLEDKALSLVPSEAVAEEIFRKNLHETLPTWNLRDSAIIDSIIHGSISAFNKTFRAIHGQGTTLLPDTSPLEAATTSTTATANIERRLLVSDEASKAGNEAIDDYSRPSSTIPEDYMAARMFCDPFDHFTESFTFHQISGDKAETTEPPMQPPTHIRSWQPGSLPPPIPNLAAYVPSLTPQDDWAFQDDAIGLSQGIERWAVDSAHLSPYTSGHQDKNF